MTIWTNGRHPTGIIWSAVGKVTDVVRLQIGLPILRYKRCCHSTALAFASSTLQNIKSHGTTSHPIKCESLDRSCTLSRTGQSPTSEFGKIFCEFVIRIPD